MGLFSDLINAAGSVGNFLFGGGGSTPSGNPNRQKQNQNKAASSNLINQRVNMPAPLAVSQPIQPQAIQIARPVQPQVIQPPRPVVPQINISANNNSNLRAQPIAQTYTNGAILPFLSPSHTPNILTPNTGANDVNKGYQAPVIPVHHASIWHDITHNPVTNFVGNDVVKPVEQQVRQTWNSPLIGGFRVGVDKLTSNQPAAASTLQAVKNDFINSPTGVLLTQKPDTIKNGKVVINPNFDNAVSSLSMGEGDLVDAPSDPMPTEPTPPESGTIPPIETKATNAPAGEAGVGTTAPTATESGTLPVLNEPAYMRGIPTTLGNAASQANLGVFNAPDQVFSADSRINPAEPVPTPTEDIPSYITKNPDAIITKATADIATIDKKLETIGTPNSQKFTARQELAQRLNATPKASLSQDNPLVKEYNRKTSVYNEKSVQQVKNNLLIERQQAQSLINMAQRAKDIASEDQVVANEVPSTASEVAHKQGSPITTDTNTLPADTPNVTFQQTDNPFQPETRPTNPYGIDPLPGLTDEQAAKLNYGKSRTSTPDRVKILSPKAQFNGSGPAGRQILQIMRNSETNDSRLEAAMNSESPNYEKLSTKDQALAADVVRGRKTSARPEINQAAQELANHFNNVEQAATSSGIPIEHRDNYIPQMVPRDYFENKANYNKTVKDLINNGHAKADAIAIVNRAKNDFRSRPNIAGHLELPREFENPQPFHAKELHIYNKQAAKRISEAQHFGPNNEELNKLLVKADANGEDVAQIKQNVEDYLHPKSTDHGTMSKAAGGVRGVTNVALLPKAALSHAGQWSNIVSDVGFRNSFKALGNRIFNSSEKNFLDRVGSNNIGKEGDSPSLIDRATAPGLKHELNFWRKVAHLGGKYNAEHLAAKGDEEGLLKAGVTGNFARGADGKIELTEAQKMQAARAESNKAIFSNSSLETSKMLKGNAGKAFGQFKTAFVAKQGGRIIDLLEEARHGNPAPLLRYLATAPIAGASVLALKNAYTTGNPNPFPKGTSLGADALNVAQDSGAESLGFGAPETAINAVRYGYNNNMDWQNAAGAVSPIAGIGVRGAQNIYAAAQGNDKGLIKQGAGYIPLPLIGKAIDNKYAPTKAISPSEQKYFNKYNPAYSKLMNTVNPFSQRATTRNVGITNTIMELTKNDHNAQGQMIQLSPAETQAKWGTIAGLPPKAQAAYIQFNKSLPNHSPAYDLKGNGTVIGLNGKPTTVSKFQVYANYEKALPGSIERSQLSTLNPWIDKTFAAEQTLYSSGNYKSTSVPYNGPLPGGVTLKDLQYPNISPSISNLMTQATKLSSIPTASRTPAQAAELTKIEGNPQLQKAYTDLSTYTNAERVARGAPPLKVYPNASPIVQSAMNYYDSLPPSKTAGNTNPATQSERSDWIKANPGLYAQMQNYYTSADLYTASKDLAENTLQGNSPTQSALKATKALASDIATNPDVSSTPPTSPQLSQATTQATTQYGVPSNIFAGLINEESGGNQSAVSPVGAIGLTQLMPATAAALGVDPNNAAQNLAGGAKYLSEMYKEFGNWQDALAAYNAGPSAVKSAGGWQNMDSGVQQYVNNILSYAGRSNATALLSTLNGSAPQYSLNAPAASAAAYASSGSSSSPSTLAYEADKAAGFSRGYINKKTVVNKKTTPGLKYSKKKIKLVKLKVDKMGKAGDGNPFVQRISYGKGVKLNKGANIFGNKTRATTGVKAA